MPDEFAATTCPVCGSPDSACGQSHPDGTAVFDLPAESTSQVGPANIVARAPVPHDPSRTMTIRTTMSDVLKRNLELVNPINPSSSRPPTAEELEAHKAALTAEAAAPDESELEPSTEEKPMPTTEPESKATKPKTKRRTKKTARDKARTPEATKSPADEAE